MGFYAKPSGGYAISSDTGKANMYAIYDYLSEEGYSDEAIIGILGNVVGESALNPWRWEGNVVNYSNGYGLFQFTPASEYINGSGIPNHAPNLSTSSTTSGASPNDALGQLYCLVTDKFGKWRGYCWRSSWSSSDYPGLYSMHTYILNHYGSGSYLSMSQFKAMDNYEYACFAFLACYEGPAVPNYSTRKTYCDEIAPIIYAYGGHRRDILLTKRIQDIQFKRKFNVC